jgi:hypothetical protein
MIRKMVKIQEQERVHGAYVYFQTHRLGSVRTGFQHRQCCHPPWFAFPATRSKVNRL